MRDTIENHPSRDPKVAMANRIPGSRLLMVNSPVIGKGIPDDDDSDRVWTVTNLYAGIPRRTGNLGVRYRCVDNSGFVSFINQRDAEVLMEIGSSGERVPWDDGVQTYASPRDANRWEGFCMSQIELNDDLYAFESWLRMYHGTKDPAAPVKILPPGSSHKRRVYVGANRFYEEKWELVLDADPTSGMGPDTALETVDKRWRRTQMTPVAWRPQR
jgi:hypothetical protein